MVKVKQGYKQTDIGVIPEDWVCVSLSEIGKVYSGGTPDTTNPKFWDGDIFWCTPTDITGLKDKKHIFDTDRKITLLGLNNSSSKLLPPNSVIVCTRATIGKAAINKVPISTNQGFKNIITESLNPDLLYYIVCDNTNRLIKVASGSTFLEVSKTEFDNFQIVVPPTKKEQQTIATALSDIDLLIDELTKLIEKKRAIKEGTIQQLLLPREGWENKRLKDKNVTRLITCGIAATPTYVDEAEGVPFLSSTNIKNGKIDWNNFKYISQDLHKQLYKNNPPQKGDILYSRVGTIGEAAIIDVDFQFSVYVSLTLIKTGRLLHNKFLMHILNSPQYKELANRTVFMGGGVGNLNVNVVRDFEITFPSLEQQQQIASILSDMDEEIEALEQNLSKYKAIKTGMMQQLLTGQIRLI